MCLLAMTLVQKATNCTNPSNNKVVVSRDGEFDEETSWNWKDPEEKRYDFLPYFGDEEEQETMAPAQDATHLLHQQMLHLHFLQRVQVKTT